MAGNVDIETTYNACFEHTSVIAIDIGNTLIKVAFVTNRETVPDCQNVRLATFPKDSEDSVISYLLETAHLRQRHNPRLHFTGLENPGFKERVCKALDTENCVQLFEIACTVTAFLQLVKCCRKSAVVYPRSESGYAAAQVMQRQIEENKITCDSVGSSADGVDIEKDQIDRSFGLRRLLVDVGWRDNFSQPYMLQEQDIMPCLLANLGAASTFTKINGDGSFRPLEGHSRSGTYIMALASLLAGITSFQDLVRMAQIGDNRNVSTYIRDMKQTACAQGFTNMPDELLLLSFGKALNKSTDDFSREDFAAAILSSAMHDIVQTAYLTALANNVNKVYFCGSLAHDEFIREKITKYFYIRHFFGDKVVEPLFLRNGAHTAALGALFTTQRDS